MSHRITIPNRPGSVLQAPSDWHVFHYENSTFEWDCHLCRESLADDLENKVIAKTFRYRAPGL